MSSWLRRVLAPPAEGDDILCSIELPPSLITSTSVLALAIATAGVAGSFVWDDGNDVINIGLPLITVLPWVLALAGVELSRWTHAAMVLVPVAATGAIDWLVASLDWRSFGFGSQFCLYLVMLMLAGFFDAPRRHLVLATAAAYAVYGLRAALGGEGFDLMVWWVALSFLTLGNVGVRFGAVVLVRAQRAIAAQAAADDRRRIARDVHDVVAHTLAVTMLHVTAARMAVLRSSSGDAVEALEEAERNGRASLADVRRIVQLLRSDDDSAIDAAQPDLSDVRALVDGYRSAGLPVELTLRGPTDRAAGTVGLTVYRVAQEALANAARHGSGGATVDLHVDGNAVVLQVSNRTGSDALRNAHGSGLVGMEERVSTAGGVLDVDARNGTWIVQARVPLEPAPAASGGER